MISATVKTVFFFFNEPDRLSLVPLREPGAGPSQKLDDFVSWDDIPNRWENKIQVSNHQPYIYIWVRYQWFCNVGIIPGNIRLYHHCTIVAVQVFRTTPRYRNEKRHFTFQVGRSMKVKTCESNQSYLRICCPIEMRCKEKVSYTTNQGPFN